MGFGAVVLSIQQFINYNEHEERRKRNGVSEIVCFQIPRKGRTKKIDLRSWDVNGPPLISEYIEGILEPLAAICVSGEK